MGSITALYIGSSFSIERFDFLLVNRSIFFILECVCFLSLYVPSCWVPGQNESPSIWLKLIVIFQLVEVNNGHSTLTRCYVGRFWLVEFSTTSRFGLKRSRKSDEAIAAEIGRIVCSCLWRGQECWTAAETTRVKSLSRKHSIRTIVFVLDCHEDFVITINYC